jgi:hypothetical protein
MPSFASFISKKYQSIVLVKSCHPGKQNTFFGFSFQNSKLSKSVYFLRFYLRLIGIDKSWEKERQDTL